MIVGLSKCHLLQSECCPIVGAKILPPRLCCLQSSADIFLRFILIDIQVKSNVSKITSEVSMFFFFVKKCETSSEAFYFISPNNGPRSPDGRRINKQPLPNDHSIQESRTDHRPLKKPPGGLHVWAHDLRSCHLFRIIASEIRSLYSRRCLHSRSTSYIPVSPE